MADGVRRARPAAQHRDSERVALHVTRMSGRLSRPPTRTDTVAAWDALIGERGIA